MGSFTRRRSLNLIQPCRGRYIKGIASRRYICSPHSQACMNYSGSVCACGSAPVLFTWYMHDACMSLGLMTQMPGSVRLEHSSIPVRGLLFAQDGLLAA